MARFGREDWLRLGRAALSEEGPAGLTVEAITRRAGRTRGSFYHHFASHEDFVGALAGAWAAEAAKAPPEAADLALERAMRRLPGAAAAVRAADAARLAAFRLGEVDPASAAARDYAEVALSVFVGAVCRSDVSPERLAALLRLAREMAVAHWNE